MGIFETIKNGFTISAKNLKLWMLLVGISIVMMLISFPVISAIFGGEIPQPGIESSPNQVTNVNWFLFIIFLIISLLIQTFINAGVMGSIKDIVKTDILNLGNFLAHAKKFFVRFVLFGLITFGIALILTLIATLLGGLVGRIGNAVNFLGVILAVILAIVTLALFLLLGICASFVPVIIAVEDKRVMVSIRLCIDFVKEKLWKCAGLVLSLFIILSFVAFINNIITRSSGGGIAYAFQIITHLIIIFLTIVYTVCMVSFYVTNTSSKISPAESV